MLVDQSRREVTLHRRSEGWASLRLSDEDATLDLASINASLSLAEFYDGVLPLAVEEERAATTGAGPTADKLA